MSDPQRTQSNHAPGPGSPIGLARPDVTVAVPTVSSLAATEGVGPRVVGSPRLSLIAPAPVLLTSSGFYGTLAAVRSLGRAGIPIVVADEARLGPASWSRFVTRRERCPGQSSSAFIDWLLAFGEEHPGHVLY